MKRKLFKRQRLLSGVLSLAMLASLCTTAFAGEDVDEAYDVDEVVTNDSSSSAQSTYATLTAEALMFNLTVPTTIPIDVSSTGVVTTGTNFYVKNNSVAPVDITSIEVTAQNDWTLVDFDTDFSKEKVDLQKYGISFFDDEASSSGVVSLNSSNWGSITGGKSLTISYDANVAAQSDSIDDEVIGLVELTIGWSDTVTYGGSESEVENIELYYTYSYVDSQGNETDTAGYVLTLTEDFAAAVNSTDAEFTDDEGNVLWETGDALPDPGSMYDGVPVTSYQRIFHDYDEMTSVDISDWDSSNVTSMYRMFYGCSNLTKVIGIDSLNMKNITNVADIFRACSSITTLDFLADWDVSNLTSFYLSFSYCSKLEDISALANWDVSSITSFKQMFQYCPNLTTLEALSGWDTGEVTTMYNMFYGCTNLEIVDLSDWDTSNVTTMEKMFYGCSSLTSLDAISDWNTSNVTTMRSMFYGCTGLTTLEVISDWDTSDVTTMEKMFCGCTNLTTLDISGWDLSNVTTTTSMFYDCSSLTTIYVGSNADAAIIASSSNFPSTCSIYVGTPEECHLYEEYD